MTGQPGKCRKTAQLEDKNEGTGFIEQVMYITGSKGVDTAMSKLEEARAEMERWQKLAGVIPANSLRDFALQTMFDLLITIANRQLSDITSRYALRAVDLKDIVVIDLWNAGE